MNTYRAGAVHDDVYTAYDNAGVVVELTDITYTAPDGLSITPGAFEAGVGHHFTVMPTAELAGTTGEIVVTGTRWRDVIYYRVDSVPAWVQQAYDHLCSKESALGYLGITDDADDATIVELIESASAAIREYAGGPDRFQPPATASRVYEVNGSAILPTECTTVTAVDFDGFDIGYRVVTTPDGSVVQWIELDYAVHGPVTVTGTFGLGVPKDIERACLVTVATWYRRNAGAAIDNAFVGRLEALPKEATDIVRRRRGWRV